MSRYADLWPVVPDDVEWLAIDGDWVFGFKHPSKEDISDYACFAQRLEGPKGDRGFEGYWRDSLERRPRPANPTLCPHCGREI